MQPSAKPTVLRIPAYCNGCNSRRPALMIIGRLFDEQQREHVPFDDTRPRWFCTKCVPDSCCECPNLGSVGAEEAEHDFRLVDRAAGLQPGTRVCADCARPCLVCDRLLNGTHFDHANPLVCPRCSDTWAEQQREKQALDEAFHKFAVDRKQAARSSDFEN